MAITDYRHPHACPCDTCNVPLRLYQHGEACVCEDCYRKRSEQRAGDFYLMQMASRLIPSLERWEHDLDDDCRCPGCTDFEVVRTILTRRNHH